MYKVWTSVWNKCQIPNQEVVRIGFRRRYTEAIYNLNEVRRRKGCGFGYGSRTDFAQKTYSPSPQKYCLPSSINVNRAKTFGSSDRSGAFGSFFMKAIIQKYNPGPNTYDLPSTMDDKNITFKKKLPTEIDLKAKERTPPPNEYNLA